MRSLVLLLGLVVTFAVAPLGERADAAHSASVCGRLLEFVPAPSDDLAHGYAHVRLSTATGDTSVLFHHTNPSNTPSITEPGSTQQGANVCISGPYVHVVGSSPYVSPYHLRLAPAGSLPSTSTLHEQGAAAPMLAVLTAVGALMALRARRQRRSPS